MVTLRTARDDNRHPDGIFASVDMPVELRLPRLVAGDSHPLVASGQFRPDGLPARHMEIRLDPSAYPATVTEGRLDVRWFTTDDYSLPLHRGAR